MVSTNARKSKTSPGPDDIDIDLEVLAQHGPQIAVTQMLLRQHPCDSSRTLAKASGTSHPTVSRTIKKIRELGLMPSHVML